MKSLSSNDAFIKYAKKIKKSGTVAAPRSSKVFELDGPQIIKLNPLKTIMTFEHRKVNYKFMAAELIWILSGDTEPWICEYLKAWSNFLDTDENGNKKLMGAYGPRLKSSFGIDQMNYVIETLKRDPFSRQAVMSITYPKIDTKTWKDFPCTMFFQFQIRNGKLNMIATMRSNDLYKGCTYDWFNFSAIQCIFASILGVKPGNYYHVANNFHFYDYDEQKIDQILSDPKVVDPLFPQLTEVDYKSLDDVYYEASFGAKLMSSGKLPETSGYVSKLLRFMKDKIDQQTNQVEVLSK